MTSEIKPGTLFSGPVYMEGDHLFVPQGVPVKQKDIDRLVKWGITAVHTEGEVLSDRNELEEAAAGIADILDSKGKSERVKLYEKTNKQLDRIFDEMRVNRAVDRSEIEEIIDRIVEETGRSPDEMIALTLRSAGSAQSGGTSATHNAILCTVVGTTLSMDHQRLKLLATAAVLHDVGMVRVPSDIVNKRADLSAEEMKRVQAHPVYSYQIIVKQLGYPEKVGLIVVQHHERWDGKGYPRRMSGKSIAVEARIVSVVDAFEAMINEKPYRNPMTGYLAVRQLLNDNSKRFDSEILKVFIRSVGIYPLGSYVLLNSGAIGRVIKIHPESPLRPAIKLIVDSDGQKHLRGDGPLVNLIEDNEQFIAKAIDIKALSGKSRA